MSAAPKTALKFALVLALGIPTGSLIGRAIVRAQAEGGARQPDGDQPGSQVPARGQAAERSRIDPQLCKEYQDAARAFAERVTKGSDGRFAEVFERAYRIAEEASLGVGRGARMAERSSP